MIYGRSSSRGSVEGSRARKKQKRIRHFLMYVATPISVVEWNSRRTSVPFVFVCFGGWALLDTIARTARGLDGFLEILRGRNNRPAGC